MPEYGRLRQPGRLSRRSSLVLSGGIEGVNGKYKYHTFTSSGSLVVASVGEPVFLECLLVGGGGSGGGTGGAGGGGGGGGGSAGTSKMTTVASTSWCSTTGVLETHEIGNRDAKIPMATFEHFIME